MGEVEKLVKYQLKFRRSGTGTYFEKHVFSLGGDELRGMIEEVGMMLAEEYGGEWVCVDVKEVKG